VSDSRITALSETNRNSSAASKGGMAKNLAVSTYTCGTINNPPTVRAYTLQNGKYIEIASGTKIKPQTVKFEWEQIAGVKSYFFHLSTKAEDISLGHYDIVDPAREGTEVQDNHFDVSTLKPGVTYYAFVRSKDSQNHLGLTYPTPGNCKLYIPAAHTFSLQTL